MDIYWSFLEITQQIFSYIPIKPLLTQVSAVCHQWYEAIQDRKVNKSIRFPVRKVIFFSFVNGRNSIYSTNTERNRP